MLQIDTPQTNLPERRSMWQPGTIFIFFLNFTNPVQHNKGHFLSIVDYMMSVAPVKGNDVKV